MKQEWKDKWVAALRSGDYEQGREGLRDYKNRYCCLGVLCDIVIAENPHLKWNKEDDSQEYDVNKSTDYPPMDIYKITGKLEIEPEDLATLNDSLRCTFEQITNIIEAGKLPIFKG